MNVDKDTTMTTTRTLIAAGAAILVAFGGCASDGTQYNRFNWDTGVDRAATARRTREMTVSTESVAGVTQAVYYDRDYPVSWVYFPQELASFLEGKGFRVLNAAETAVWMRELTRTENGAAGTVIVMSMGVAPKSLLTPRTKDSLFYKYMRAGGRIVWIGDYPLYFLGDKGGFTEEYGTNLSWVLMNIDGTRLKTEEGVEFTLEDTNVRGASVTDEGRAWGMHVIDHGYTQFLSLNVTKVLSDIHPLYCTSFYKTFNSLLAGSGLVRYRSSPFDGRDAAQREDVYRIATYKPTPVKR
jgi:hypothetical protein